MEVREKRHHANDLKISKEPQVKECRWSLKARKAKEINLPQNLKKAYVPSNTLVVDF